MKESIRKNIVDLPYSLHDARVNQITIEAQSVQLHFSKGYYEPVDDDCVPVKGNRIVSIEGLDFDFCSIYLLDIKRNHGKFTGEKLSLKVFINKFPTINFEIIDETYGYNQSRFSGYLYLGRKMKECIIELYHFGDMKYLVEEET